MNLVDKQTLNIYQYGTPNPSWLTRVTKALFGNGLFISRQEQQLWTALYNYKQARKEDLVNKGYGGNVTVYSVISTISKVAAQAPWSVYKVKNRSAYNRVKAIQSQPYSAKQQMALKLAKEEALEPIQNHWLNERLQRPNEQQSMYEYMENLLGFKLLTGDCYELAVKTDDGRIGEMWILPSQNIEILTDEYGVFPMREKGYRMQFGTKRIEYKAEEVCHSRYWSPYYNGDGSHLYGFSPLDAAWINVLQDNNAREAAVELLKNRGNRGVFLWENQNLQEVAAQQTAEGLKEKWGQASKEYKDKIIPVYGKGQWLNIGLNAKDLAILDICKMNKDDICNAYGASSILFNNTDSSSYNNYITARKELITRAVLPLLCSIRDARNRKFATDWAVGSEKIVVDFDQTIYTELYDDVWEMAKDMRTVGAYTDNEIRVQTNYEAITAPYANDIWKKSNDIPSSLITPETVRNGQRNNQETGTGSG